MHPLAILLVLLSAAMHAFRNFFNKKALDKQAFVWWYEVFGLIFFTPLFLFTLLHEGTNTHISIAFIFLSGFVHFIYWYFLSKALEKGDLSLIYPIMRSSPALVLIFSITILGEDVSVFGVIGILLVAIHVSSPVWRLLVASSRSLKGWPDSTMACSSAWYWLASLGG